MARGSGNMGAISPKSWEKLTSAMQLGGQTDCIETSSAQGAGKHVIRKYTWISIDAWTWIIKEFWHNHTIVLWMNSRNIHKHPWTIHEILHLDSTKTIKCERAPYPWTVTARPLESLVTLWFLEFVGEMGGQGEPLPYPKNQRKHYGFYISLGSGRCCSIQFFCGDGRWRGPLPNPQNHWNYEIFIVFEEVGGIMCILCPGRRIIGNIPISIVF